jgi:ribosome-binding factor A
MQTQRQQRLNKLFREEISEMVLRHLKDPRLGMLTITEVNTAPDLSTAVVYISAQGDKEAREATLEGLKSAAGHIRTELSKKIHLRRIPELLFRLDLAQERGDRILDLLDQVSQEIHKDDDTGSS